VPLLCIQFGSETSRAPLQSSVAGSSPPAGAFSSLTSESLQSKAKRSEQHGRWVIGPTGEASSSEFSGQELCRDFTGNLPLLLTTRPACFRATCRLQLAKLSCYSYPSARSNGRCSNSPNACIEEASYPSSICMHAVSLSPWPQVPPFPATATPHSLSTPDTSVSSCLPFDRSMDPP
jgi:hypothetical protein